MSKLAVITTEYLKTFTEKSLEESGIPFDYELHVYNNFSDITGVYERVRSRTDGVITSGGFAAETLRLAYPNSAGVIASFDVDDAGLYWLIIQLMRDPKFDPSRVYFDFFDILGIDLETFITSPPRSTIADLLNSYLRGMTMERMLKVEEFCINRHMTLRRQGKIDMSVTRFSSIAQQLEDSGIPMRFVYPGIDHIKDVCVRALQEVQIKMLQQNLLAVVEVTAGKDCATVELAAEWVRVLENELNRFKRANTYDFMLIPIPRGFEIFTSRRVVGELTNNCKGCLLQDYFRKNMKTPVYIGYGIGNDMYQARMNAIVANREAMTYRNGGSCLINERDEMFPQLENLRGVVVKRGTHPALRQTSKKSGLSPLTIQKIIAVARDMEKHCVTSRDVANKMGITRRSANRFLSALTRTKTARVVCEKNSTTKGRPERVYQISIPD